MHFGIRILVGMALLAIAVTGTAHGSVIYTYTAEHTAYTANVNTHLTINLYLQETLNSSSSVISGNGGLLSAGISVMRESAVPTSPAGLAGFSFNHFDFGGPTSTDQSLTATAVQFSELIAKQPAPGVALGNTGNGTATGYPNRVFLGSLDILAGTIADQSTSFDVFLDDVGGAGGYTLTKTNLFDLDISSTNPPYTGAQDAGLTTFTVTTVSTPEPRFFPLASFAAASLLLRRRRSSVQYLVV